MRVVIKSDYGGKVRDFVEQSDHSFQAEDGTVLPPPLPQPLPPPPPPPLQSPPYGRDGETATGKDLPIWKQRLRAGVRLGLFVLCLLSGAGLVVHYAPLLLALALRQPELSLMLVFVISAALLMMAFSP